MLSEGIYCEDTSLGWGYPALIGLWLSYWWLSCPWQCGSLNLGMANEEGLLAGLMAAAKVGNVSTS